MKIKGVLKRVGVMALAFSMLIPVVPSQAAKQPKLNKTVVTLKSHKKVTLVVKNAKSKVKWSISGNRENIESVDTWGKNKSKCTIVTPTISKNETVKVTAKIKKKKLTCKLKLVKDKSVTENTPAPIVTQTPIVMPIVTPAPTLSPQEIQNQAFDTLVKNIKDNGELNKYGTRFVYYKASATISGDKVYLYESYDEDGHTVEITKGSNIATATVQLKIGTATASFDISTFKGDGTDSLQWSNNPTFANAITYDAAVTNVIKELYNYKSLYLGSKTSMQDLGFTSYAFDK